jgi:prepilin signal peptidase PulO-like enzyme (type II secretory pathway)
LETNPELWWWIGLFWAVVLGWAGSSYLSNFINRLPLGEAFFKREPYCAHCQTGLQPIDLAPILSYLLTRGKCRYCKSPVPLSYFLVELLFPLFSAIYYIQFGFGSVFLLCWLTSGLLLIMFFAALRQNFLSMSTLLIVAIAGLFMKTLAYDSVLDGLLHGFIGLFLCMTVWTFFNKTRHGDISPPSAYQLPAEVWMVASAAIWFRVDAIIAALCVAAISGALVYGRYSEKSSALKAMLIFTPTILTLSIAGY